MIVKKESTRRINSKVYNIYYLVIVFRLYSTLRQKI